MKKWTLPVTEDPETGDMLLEFPDDVLEAVGWKIGDTIEWDLQMDGTCILKRMTGGDERSTDQA